MAGETEDDIPESGAVFTFGKSKFADNIPSKFWMKNDKPLRIYCGDEHTALITDNGKLFMFGNNNCGQLGLGTKTTVNKPTCVKALKCENVKLAACGRNHTLLATSRGNVYAAGGNGEGQLGLGDCIGRASFHRLHFFSGHVPIKMLAAGANTSAALTEDGMLFMWGDNSEGQIGLGNESHAPNPRGVSVGRPVIWVSCGYYHSAFVTVDGNLFTFGECNGGKLGLPPEQCSNHRVPQPVLGIPNRVTQVACGGAHTVALTAEGVYTFGLGQYGQLGLGTFIFQAHLPKRLDYFHNGRVNRVACGENHTAVITDSGLLYTFGDGRHGKLGLGVENFANQFKPTVNPRFLKHRVLSVTCGGCHMLVLARPRSKDSGPLRLEEGDVTEDYLEKSFKELLEGGSTFPILHRSLDARVRRRERERSPEQFGLMVSTLPTVTASFLNTSMAISSCALPPRLPSQDLQNGVQYIRHPSSPKMDTMTLEGTADAEDVKDDGSVKDLGDTADPLNNRTHRTKDLSDKVLSVSPVHKAKKAKAVKQHGKTVKGEEPNWAPPKGGADSVRQQALPTELLRGSGLSKAPQHVDTAPREKRPASPRADGSQLLTRQPAEVKRKLKAGRGKPVPCKNQPAEQDNPSEVQNVTTMARGQAMSQSGPLEVSRKSEKVQIKHPEIKSTPIEVTRYKPTEKKGRQRKATALITEVKERPVAGGKGHTAVGGEPQTVVGGEPRVKVKSMPMKGKGKAVEVTREKTFAADSRDFLKNQEAAVCTERPLGLSSAPKPKTTPAKVKAVTVVRSQSPEQKRTSDNKTTTHGLKEPIVVSEVDRTEPTSHQWNLNVLTDVYSHLPEVGMESPARILTETVTRGAEPEPGSEDAASTPRRLSRTERSTKQRAIADPSWSESLESVSGSGKRTSVVINVLPEAGGSELEVETISMDQGRSGTDTLEDVKSGNQTESGEDSDSPVSDDRRKEKSLEKEEEDDGGRPREANGKSRNKGLMYGNMDSSGGEPECEEAVEEKAEGDKDSKDEDEVNSKTRSSEEESEEDDTASRAKKSTSDQEESEEDTEKGEKSNVDNELESETEATVNGEGSGQEKDTEEESEQEEEEEEEEDQEEESLDKDQNEGEESIASVTEEEASGDESESKGEESEVVSEEEDAKGEDDESTVEVEGEETEDESGIEEEEEDEDDENDVEAEGEEEGEEEESTEEEEEGDQNEESSVEEEDEKEGEEGDQEEGSSVEEEEEADDEEEPDEEEEGEGSSVEEEEEVDEEEEPDKEEESGTENEEGKEEDEEEENEGEDEDEEEGKGETDEESDNEEEGEGEEEDEGREEGENEDEEEFEGDEEGEEDEENEEEGEEENQNEGEGGEGDEGEEEEENEEEEKSVEERKQDGQKQKSKPLGKKSETKLAQSGITGKRSAKKPEISGPQDSQQFWNNVLPQYLNLK